MLIWHDLSTPNVKLIWKDKFYILTFVKFTNLNTGRNEYPIFIDLNFRKFCYKITTKH